MLYIKNILAVIIIVVMASCRAPVEVTTDRTPGFSLDAYQTFSFVREETTPENEMVWAYLTEIGLIKDALRQNLQDRGLTYVEENPDLKINIGIVVEEQIQTRETNFVTDPPQYIGQRRYAWRVHDVEVGRYQQGTLSIHLVDNEKDELVWEGVAEAVIPRDQERQARKINESVSEMVRRM